MVRGMGLILAWMCVIRSRIAQRNPSKMPAINDGVKWHKQWRGFFISLPCALFLLVYFDYERPIVGWEKLLFVSVMLVGMLGVALYFFDFARNIRNRNK
uniref:Transmembrane protein n=1 Tax=Ralstonia syzygii R24 TaxID=907261 RepID=G3ACC5_9RALS|nr:hypothetical protein RALSY_mp30535 [Ralstonia syzygii R24]